MFFLLQEVLVMHGSRLLFTFVVSLLKKHKHLRRNSFSGTKAYVSTSYTLLDPF